MLQHKKKLFWKITSIFVAGVTITAVFIYLVYLNYTHFRQEVIFQTQGQLLAVAQSTAKSLEEFFASSTANLKAIARDPVLQKEVRKGIHHDKPDETFCAIKNIYDVQDGIDSLSLLDAKGIVLHRHSFIAGRSGRDYSNRPDVANILTEHKPHVSKVFLNALGNQAISISEPVFYKDQFVGIIQWMIELDTIYERFLEPITIGKEGYKWIIDQNGIVLGHDSMDHVGECLFDHKRENFPDYDWSAFEGVMARATQGEEVTGFFVCPRHGKRILVCAPAYLKNQRWLIGLSMSYSEVAGHIREHERNTFGLAGMIIFASLMGGYLFFRSEKRKAELKAERKHLKKIAESAEALRSERDKFQVMLSAMGDGVNIMNRDFVIEYQNKVLKELFGDRAGEKCHRVYMDADEPCGFCRIHDSIRRKEAHYAEVVMPDGTSYEQSCAPFTDIDGEDKVIVLLRDISDRKALQAEAMRAGHLASLGELAAGVAHEINNPINGIINYAQIMADDSKEQGQEADIPKRIIKEGNRIAEIVKNLLSFARDRKDEYSPALVQDILADSLSLTKTQIQKDGITLRLDVPDGFPKIKARSQEIQQVFVNILSNARYALNQKFPGIDEDKVLEITGELLEIEGRRHIRITFYDHGTGIPDQTIERLCEPFFSSKPRGEGTGLGLSISYGIIKDHGGRLWFDSVEGEYTKVMVDLPVDNGWKSK